MSEYIEREALMRNLKQFAYEQLTPLVESLIQKQPTADVLEVRHGKWDIVEYGSGWVDGKCSVCGYTDCFDESGFYIYCPECGAKMDGKEYTNE